MFITYKLATLTCSNIVCPDGGIWAFINIKLYIPLLADKAEWFNAAVICHGLQEIKLSKFPTEKLGISIRGGIDSVRGNPHDDADKGVFISKARLCFFSLLCS